MSAPTPTSCCSWLCVSRVARSWCPGLPLRWSFGLPLPAHGGRFNGVDSEELHEDESNQEDDDERDGRQGRSAVEVSASDLLYDENRQGGCVVRTSGHDLRQVVHAQS